MNIYLPERIVHWPRVNLSKQTVTDEMYAKIICHPPLGQATTQPAGSAVVFHAVLETHEVISKTFELALWSNLNGNETEWQATPFAEVEDEDALFSLGGEAGLRRRRLFTLTVPSKSARKDPLRFTIRFRQASESSWKWVSEHSSASDGVIYFLADTAPKGVISDYLDGISSDIEFNDVAAETDDTLLWALEAPVKAALDEQSGYSSYKLGIPKHFTRWFALVRLWAPWLAPRHGQRKFGLDKDAIVCSFLRHDGLSVVAIAISGIDDVLTLFQSDDDGNVIIHARNDAPSEGTAHVLVAVASSFEVANSAVMYQARRMVISASAQSGEAAAELEALKGQELEPQWFEEWCDGFAYCTWNGLGQNLTEDKIFQALDSLEKNGINITNLIIDDNWQSLDNEGYNQMDRGMLRFEANERGFPSGLHSTVSRIRKEHPSIRHVAVWHAMFGYWGAISPDGQLAKNYKTVEAKKPGGGTWTCIHPDDVGRFYNDFYEFLSHSGVNSVKTDAQFMLDDLQSAPDRRAMIQTYQDAWTVATLRHLRAQAISCMSQTPQIIFHSQLPHNKPRLLVRNSDDFFPDIESSHAWHVFCNAHNSLLTQHLNALPDWDMFQTSHAWAAFHAAARCVSGGPIYFTDAPGAHDVGLIAQMTAKTPRGNTVILRPARVGKTSGVYTSYDEQRLLKVDTYVGGQTTGVAILGIFNVSQHPLSEILHLADFPGTQKGHYIVRSHVSGKLSKPLARDNGGSNPVILVELSTRGYDVLSAYPLQSFMLDPRGVVAVANLGLLGKMTGAAAIVNTEVHVEDNGRLRLWTSLKALGTLGMYSLLVHRAHPPPQISANLLLKKGLYISLLPALSIEDDLMGLLFGKPIPLKCVQRCAADPHVLEIDVETAWRESDQNPGWSNEVNVEIFMR